MRVISRDVSSHSWVVTSTLPDGSGQGTTLVAEELRLMIDDYYEARGWTEEGLIPAEQLAKLGLEDLS